MKYIFLLKYPVIRSDTGYPVLEISRISGIRPTGPSLIIITCVSRGKSFRFIGQAKVNDTLKIKKKYKYNSIHITKVYQTISTNKHRIFMLPNRKLEQVKRFVKII